MVHELRLRNIAADTTLGVRELTDVLKENEYPQWKERQNAMNDEENHDAKFFSPRRLSVDEWDKENIIASNMQHD